MGFLKIKYLNALLDYQGLGFELIFHILSSSLSRMPH